MSLSLLIIDDDTTSGEALARYFTSVGYTVHVAATAASGRRAAAAHSPDVALIDFRLPDADGFSLIKLMRADDPELALIVLTGHADVRTALRAMRLGTADLVEKPVDVEALREAVERVAEQTRVERELRHMRARDVETNADAWISPSLDKLIELAAHNADVPVLIVGERGTGKDALARRIHARSPRGGGAFVSVNCGSHTPLSLDSELFGVEQGAPAARGAKRGLLEVARAGTLLFNNVADLPSSTQPKLLTAIEDGVFHRVGGTAVLRCDARVMAATSAPLREAVAAGRFRPDLFYRLQVLTIELAPLRARRAEIPALLDSLLPRGATVSDAGRRAIESYDWPGNVRELKNALWRASLLADAQQITPAHLALGVAKAGMLRLSDSAVNAEADGDVFTIADAERRAIVDALRATGGNKLRAAQLLGIARSTLLEKVRRFGLA